MCNSLHISNNCRTFASAKQKNELQTKNRAETYKRHKIMTLTNYTKYCLENGREIILGIANWYGFNEKQIAKLKNAGARLNKYGEWVVDMNKYNYQAICKSLRGFHMGYFQMK